MQLRPIQEKQNIRKHRLLIRLSAIILFAALSLQLSLPTLLSINYSVHKEAITELFCINKDKPDMGCQGKCHLKKQIEETNPPASKKEMVHSHKEYDFFLEAKEAINPNNSIAEEPDEAIYSNAYQFLFSNSLFRPPQNFFF